jgi:serine/threonine protein kinase
MTKGIGTPLWMAPALANDTEEVSSNAVDVYAFAVTVWQGFTATNRPEFADGSVVRSHYQCLQKATAGCRLAKPPECPDCWWGIVARAWSHDPASEQIVAEIEAPVRAGPGMRGGVPGVRRGAPRIPRLAVPEWKPRSRPDDDGA